MIYFLALCIVACVLLQIIDFINNWLKTALSIYLLKSSLAFCLFYHALFPTCYMYCAWAVVAVSFERFLVVCFPFRAKTICTCKSAKVTVVVMIFPIAVYNLYNYWVWELDFEGNCNIVNKYAYFMYYVGPWISGALYSYIPTLMLIFCNAAIVLKLARQLQLRLAMTGSEMSQASLKEAKVTRTVCAICLSYLLLTTPVAMYYTIQFYAGEFVYQGPEMRLAEVFIDQIGLSHYATNFFLYIVTSDSFRSEFIVMVTCRPNVETQSMEVVSSKTLRSA